jgi:hypothetical protein
MKPLPLHAQLHVEFHKCNEVDGLKWLLITTSHFLLHMNHAISIRDGYLVQIEAVVTFLIILGAHMNILFHIEVKILMLTRWSYI